MFSQIGDEGLTGGHPPSILTVDFIELIGNIGASNRVLRLQDAH